VINLGFDGDYGVYHSMYDDHYWMSHIGDPAFDTTSPSRESGGSLRFVSPMRTFFLLISASNASSLEQFLRELEQKNKNGQRRLPVKRLHVRIAKFEKRATFCVMPSLTIFCQVRPRRRKIQRLNEQLLQVESNWLDPRAFPAARGFSICSIPLATPTHTWNSRGSPKPWKSTTGNWRRSKLRCWKRPCRKTPNCCVPRRLPGRRTNYDWSKLFSRSCHSSLLAFGNFVGRGSGDSACQAPRPRLGVPFDGTPGPLNAITDVSGVTVGHTTLISGEGKLQVGNGPVRTGVTAVLPRGKDSMNNPVFAGWWSLNGNGEMTGTTWVEESGFLEVP